MASQWKNQAITTGSKAPRVAKTVVGKSGAVHDCNEYGIPLIANHGIITNPNSKAGPIGTHYWCIDGPTKGAPMEWWSLENKLANGCLVEVHNHLEPEPEPLSTPVIQNHPPPQPAKAKSKTMAIDLNEERGYEYLTYEYKKLEWERNKMIDDNRLYDRMLKNQVIINDKLDCIMKAFGIKFVDLTDDPSGRPITNKPLKRKLFLEDEDDLSVSIPRAPASPDIREPDDEKATTNQPEVIQTPTTLPDPPKKKKVVLNKAGINKN